MSLFMLVLLVASVVICLALAVFCAEVLAGLPAPRRGAPAGDADAFAVLMPAHNEAKVIAATVASTLAALRPGDRLLVVADNCDDDTATIARGSGAEVVERHDPARRGKGYALAHGIAALARDAPACVIVLDADCRPQPGALERLAARAGRSGRPVQACYLLEPGERGGPVTRFSSFAFMLKNRVRQLGMARISGTCVLTGSGMAFPWSIIAQAQLADGETVEDLVLGLRLALDGHLPLFEAEAVILSDPPPSDRAAEAQRGRWERGFVSAALRFSPALFAGSLRRGQSGLAWLALHLLVPPFVLLFLAALGLVFLQAAASAMGAVPRGLWLSVGMTASAIGCVGLVWWRHGRAYLGAKDALRLPRYILAKTRIWAVQSRSGASIWNKTDR